MNEDVADRREHFYSRDYLDNFCPQPSSTPKKREIKEQRLKEESKSIMSGSNSNHDFLSFDDEDESGSLYENSSRNCIERVELRPDGRPRRKTKKKKHFDEEYPPEEQTPKKRRSNLRINSKSNMAVILPQVSRKSLSGREKSIRDDEELHSDNEEYK